MGEATREPTPPLPLITEVDRLILTERDEEFKPHEWDDMKKIVDANDLEVLRRWPSAQRKYMQWTAETEAEYGSLTNYILAHRLPKSWGSPPFTSASPVPFENPADYRVLVNDWPYGFAPDMTHLVVWTRTRIKTEPVRGDLTPESRRIIQDFVDRLFVATVGENGEDRVIWFKNWVALQSVRTLEHIHVIVRNLDRDILRDWTEEKPWHRRRATGREMSK
ncbi:hypothetical protein ACRALDRAFT_1077889 [Sodiomyces alcalophilus JCM 7366]|uniref:uncharacterized protein n=1 Tax=Sodiomyces alcalophilus JCM 7366 TaxID=591952 RepID=UPI0039B3835D